MKNSCLVVGFVYFFFAANVNAGSKHRPPPKATASPVAPVDVGPTLEATAKFIEETVNEWGLEAREFRATTTTGYYTKGIPGQHVSINAGSCTMKESAPAGVDPTIISLRRIRKVEVKKNDSDVQKSERIMAGRLADDAVAFTPETFDILIYLPGGEGRSGKSTDTDYTAHTSTTVDLKDLPYELFFTDQDVAMRIAKALTHAAELCGAGASQPF